MNELQSAIEAAGLPEPGTAHGGYFWIAQNDDIINLRWFPRRKIWGIFHGGTKVIAERKTPAEAVAQVKEWMEQ